MKIAVILALALPLAMPAFAQDSAGTPLIRVYIDAPYFYEILADVTDGSDPRAQDLTLLVEGKEVGESKLVYDCETGDYSEKVVTEWTGQSKLFMQPALMAYHVLHCKAAVTTSQQTPTTRQTPHKPATIAPENGPVAAWQTPPIGRRAASRSDWP